MAVDAGPVSDFMTQGTFRLVGDFIVGNNNGGLYAYSSVCTHQGCTVPAPASATANSSCPCHLSQFNSNGDVQPGGMATRNLAHYAVMINSGRVMVDTSMVVTDRSVRTPIA